ncbi:hypothetical protein AVEN_12217-1 [Araneus ventricosus]|uniref:Uncharacterized protein n=1 Tax=Araneus ventricosus TaxID=182803 RepID=A0A4Y2HZM1_ARAVE|nr:hypothetical protein AVEN_12217-1 [Araneus ventricosus]
MMAKFMISINIGNDGKSEGISDLRFVEIAWRADGPMHLMPNLDNSKLKGPEKKFEISKNSNYIYSLKQKKLHFRRKKGEKASILSTHNEIDSPAEGVRPGLFSENANRLWMTDQY